MLVSHRHRFIYTKTRKTAGTSVEAFFERYCMREGEWEPSHARDEYESEAGVVGFRGGRLPPNTRWWNHMPAADIRAHLGEEVWNGYFKFCVVRNPYEKCISKFEYGAGGAAGAPDPATGPDRAGPTRLAPPAALRTDDGGAAAVHRFVRRSPPVDDEVYKIDGRLCVDGVIRFESLADDIRGVCARLGLPFEPSALPRYKKSIRRPQATAATLFTPAARVAVERAFAFELAEFDYAFPGDESSSPREEPTSARSAA